MRYAYGTAISTLPGATVSLVAGPGPGGAPTIGNWGYQALGNSVTGNYPTGQEIDFNFAGPTSGISFTFDNYGNNTGYGDSSYYAYDGATLVTSGDISDLSSGLNLVTVAGSGITELQVTNGSGGAHSWYYGIGEISYSVSAPGPVPGAGLAGLAALALAGLYARTRRA